MSTGIRVDEEERVTGRRGIVRHGRYSGLFLEQSHRNALYRCAARIRDSDCHAKAGRKDNFSSFKLTARRQRRLISHEYIAPFVGIWRAKLQTIPRFRRHENGLTLVEV